jgi:hypothetical protein
MTKHRLTGFALAAGLAFAVAAPAAPAHAWTCAEAARAVCDTIAATCQTLHRHGLDATICHAT